MTLHHYIELFSDYLKKNNQVAEPFNLYSPIQYILDLGGKRIRPILTMISADGFGGKREEALAAAMAVEVFHNFTLLHDDIMDRAPIRRGKPTVHEKWNENTAILSGDVMMIKSFQYLENYQADEFKNLFLTLSKTAVEVCEGQQSDMDFESKNEVSIKEYLDMITNKTAVLLGAALKMGAIIAQTSIENQEKIYLFGMNLGIAFQLQDDYLDTFGDEDSFGKVIGGDIMENKKTWLILKTIELADATDRDLLLSLYSNYSKSKEEVAIVKNIFLKYKIHELIQKEMEVYVLKSQEILENLDFKIIQKEILSELIQQLKKRAN